MRFLQVLFNMLSLITLVISWPDGAPCIHAVFESMNPLEAVEHQGGLQLTIPPYHIAVRQKCYWKNQPIELSLRGNTSTDRFRGFALQPISYRGPNQGKRVGQFLRLDDNGSWQQQCFRFKNSVTHSHDEKKKQIKLWWKNELSDNDYVQFVATVVKAQKQFWVKSIKSIPIPPCRIESTGIKDYIPDPITPPPPANQFKLETFVIFDALDNNLQHNLLRAIRNDSDNRPKPQTLQDFLKVVDISNQLRPKLTPSLIPTTQFVVAEPLVRQQTAVLPVRPTFVPNFPSVTQSEITQQISSITPSPQQQQQSSISNPIPLISSQSEQTTTAIGQPLQRIFRLLPSNQFQQKFNRVAVAHLRPQIFPLLSQTTNFQRSILRRRFNPRIIPRIRNGK